MDQIHIFPDGKEVQLLDASEAAEQIMVDAPGSFFDLLTETDISVRMGVEVEDGAKGVDKPGLARFKAFVRRSVRD